MDLDSLKQVFRRLCETSFAADEMYRPSELWLRLASFQSYLFNLGEEDLKDIRLHTYFFNGDNLWTYATLSLNKSGEEEARNLRYTDSVEGIPEEYWVGEPAPKSPWPPVGVSYRGRLINYNTTRMQRVVSDFYRIGVFERLRASDRRATILEIGGGFGALAGHLAGLLKDRACYVSVDIPQSLFIQALYLRAYYPQLRVMVWDGSKARIDKSDLERQDLILVPNFCIDAISGLTDIAIAVNMQSFQEMTDRQVCGYLDLLADRLTGFLYCENVDRHPDNAALGSLREHLAARFVLHPDPAFYATRWAGTSYRWACYYEKYVCGPRGRESVFDLQQLGLPYAPTDMEPPAVFRRGAEVKPVAPAPAAATQAVPPPESAQAAAPLPVAETGVLRTFLDKLTRRRA